MKSGGSNDPNCLFCPFVLAQALKLSQMENGYLTKSYDMALGHLVQRFGLVLADRPGFEPRYGSR